MTNQTQTFDTSKHILNRRSHGKNGKSYSQGIYGTRQRKTLAEAPGLRVRLLSLTKGQCVPWHFHSVTTDTFFCMRGPMRVLTRSPAEAHTLHDGDTLSVAPGTPHYVEATDATGCQFMIVQGVGKYDYVPVTD